MRRPRFKRRNSKRLPLESVWREKIVPYYESGATMADVCKAFRMDMRTLRRELPKYTKIRPPGPRPGFKRKPYGHYPKEEVTQNEPDTSSAEPRADLLTKPFDLNEEPIPNREVKQGDPKAGSKPKRKIIPI